MMTPKSLTLASMIAITLSAPVFAQVRPPRDRESSRPEAREREGRASVEEARGAVSRETLDRIQRGARESGAGADVRRRAEATQGQTSGSTTSMDPSIGREARRSLEISGHARNAIASYLRSEQDVTAIVETTRSIHGLARNSAQRGMLLTLVNKLGSQVKQNRLSSDSASLLLENFVRSPHFQMMSMVMPNVLHALEGQAGISGRRALTIVLCDTSGGLTPAMLKVQNAIASATIAAVAVNPNHETLILSFDNSVHRADRYNDTASLISGTTSLQIHQTFGGTDYNEALTHAFQIAAGNQYSLDNLNIVMISDGTANIDTSEILQESNRVRSSTNIRMAYFQLGSTYSDTIAEQFQNPILMGAHRGRYSEYNDESVQSMLEMTEQDE